MLLIRYHSIGLLDQIEDELFASGRRGSPTSRRATPVQPGAGLLPLARTPDRSWITAAGCVLDTAAVLRRRVDRPPVAAGADSCIRTGFLCLRRIADFFAIPYDPDPAPDDPISRHPRASSTSSCAELATPASRCSADRDQAWRDFAGWRVNYDPVLIALATLVDGAVGAVELRPPGDRTGRAVQPRRVRLATNARRRQYDDRDDEAADRPSSGHDVAPTIRRSLRGGEEGQAADAAADQRRRCGRRWRCRGWRR